MFLLLNTFGRKIFRWGAERRGRGRDGPVKTYWFVWEEGGDSAVSTRMPNLFFLSGSSQNRNKIKKVSYSDSQNFCGSLIDSNSQNISLSYLL